MRYQPIESGPRPHHSLQKPLRLKSMDQRIRGNAVDHQILQAQGEPPPPGSLIDRYIGDRTQRLAMALQAGIEIFGLCFDAENEAQQFRQVMLGQTDGSQLPVVGAQPKTSRGLTKRYVS